MRTRSFVPIVAAAVALLAAASPQAASTVVMITAAGYVPEAVVTKTDAAVTWRNADTVNHQVVSADAKFQSPVLRPGQTFSHTFTEGGDFTFEDPLTRPRIRGTVKVVAPPAGVTIESRPAVARFGARAVISGRILSGAENEPVVVLTRACAGTFTRLGDVTTTAGGVWTMTVRAYLRTDYRAQWGGTTSTSAVLRVRPILRLSRAASGRYVLRVQAARSFAGRRAALQRWDAARRRWVGVGTVRQSRLARAGATVTSGGSATANLRPRTRVRAVIGPRQAGACYESPTSNAVR